MNRRNFLALMGIAPAAAALPQLPAPHVLTNAETVEFEVTPSMLKGHLEDVWDEILQQVQARVESGDIKLVEEIN